MLAINRSERRSVLTVQVTGKLTKEDYRQFNAKAEALINRHGKVRILVELCDFHGWTAGALWEDVKFDFKHYTDIDRLALVGNKGWEKGLSVFSKPFTAASVRYFNITEMDEAKTWVEEGG
jgi:hypothetical protein